MVNTFSNVQKLDINFPSPYAGVYHTAPLTFINLFTDNTLNPRIIKNITNCLKNMETVNSYYKLEAVNVIDTIQDKGFIHLIYHKRPVPVYIQDVQNPIITPKIMENSIFKDFDYLNPLGTHETTGITLLIGNMEAPEDFTIVITMP